MMEIAEIAESLPPVPARLLRLIASRPGQVLSRHELLDGWPLPEGFVTLRDSTRVVDVHVQALRRVLAPTGTTIASVRGIGYRLEDGRSPGRIVDLGGGTTLDYDRLLVCGPAGDVAVTRLESRLLRLLGETNRAVTHTDLWRRATRENYVVGACLRTHIATLRKKLRQVGSRSEIVGGRGRCYRLSRPCVPPISTRSQTFQEEHTGEPLVLDYTNNAPALRRRPARRSPKGVSTRWGVEQFSMFDALAAG